MSKISYALLAVMVAALIFMGAVRLRELHQRNQALQEEQSRNDGEPFSFQHIPVSFAAPQVKYQQNPVEYNAQGPIIYLEDTPLSPEQHKQQARATVSSILADFEQNTALAGFNREINEVSGGKVKGLEDLSTQNLMQIVQKNPQIQGVVEKYMKNPDFSKAIEEIFNNPQFQQSVKELQQDEPLFP